MSIKYEPAIGDALKALPDQSHYKLYCLYVEHYWPLAEIMDALDIKSKSVFYRMMWGRKVKDGYDSSSENSMIVSPENIKPVRIPYYNLFSLWKKLGIPMWYFLEHDIPVMKDPLLCDMPESFIAGKYPVEYQKYIQRYFDYLAEAGREEFSPFANHKMQRANSEYLWYRNLYYPDGVKHEPSFVPPDYSDPIAARAIKKIQEHKEFDELVKRIEKENDERYQRFLNETTFTRDEIIDLTNDAIEELIIGIRNVYEEITSVNENHYSYWDYMANTWKDRLC